MKAKDNVKLRQASFQKKVHSRRPCLLIPVVLNMFFITP